MTGFLDRLLHADKPQPLDVDTAAAMLSTTPGLLREFERSYHANVLDRKNAPTGPLGPDAKTVVDPVPDTGCRTRRWRWMRASCANCCRIQASSGSTGNV